MTSFRAFTHIISWLIFILLAWERFLLSHFTDEGPEAEGWPTNSLKSESCWQSWNSEPSSYSEIWNMCVCEVSDFVLLFTNPKWMGHIIDASNEPVALSMLVWCGFAQAVLRTPLTWCLTAGVCLQCSGIPGPQLPDASWEPLELQPTHRKYNTLLACTNHLDVLPPELSYFRCFQEPIFRKSSKI